MTDFDFSDLGESDFDDSFVHVAPGDYIATVIAIDDSGEKSSSVIADFRIDAAQPGSPDGFVNKVHREYLPTSQKALVRIAKLLEACGWNRSQLSGRNVQIDLNAAVGRQLEITIEPHSYQDNAGNEVNTTRISFKGFRRLSTENGPEPKPDPYSQL